MPSKPIERLPDGESAPGYYRGYREIDISRYQRLKHAQDELTKRWGPGPWDQDKVVDLMREREARKVEELLASVAPARAQKITRDHQQVAKKEAYRRAFPDVTPNDDVLIDQLVEIELQLEELSEDAHKATLTEKGDNLSDKAKRGKLRLDLIAEHRRIQNELGIVRSKRQDELDAAKVITETARRGRQLLGERSVPIRCPKCHGTHAINQGFILFHFAEHVSWQWTSTCPNPECGAEIVITGKKRSSNGSGSAKQIGTKGLPRLRQGDQLEELPGPADA